MNARDSRLDAIRLVRGELRRSRQAAQRLKGARDPEALHDFRVAVRRLRVFLRAYRGLLGKAGGHGNRLRLKAITAATNPIRDEQVLERLLTEARKHAAGPRALAVQRRLESDFNRDIGKVPAIIVPDYEYLAASIDHELNEASKKADGRGVAKAFSRRAESDAARLKRNLRRIHSRKDAAEIHASRISAKRLRYLLEPFERKIKRGPKLIGELKEIQRTLGDLHDLQLLEDLIGTGNRWVREREERLFGGFSKKWLKRKHRRFFRRLSPPKNN